MPVFLKQTINQYLCITLICLMTFWTTLYYFTFRAQVLGDEIVIKWSEYLRY